MPENPLHAPISRRRLLILGGGTIAASALAACGGSDGSSSDAAPGAGTAAEGSTATSGAAAADGELPTIEQWYHQYGEEGTQAAVERYADSYPDAEVNVTWQPGDYDQTTAASLLTDDGPDVFEYGNGPTIDMIKAGQVVDLTDAFGDAKDDFNPSILERVTYDGKIWAIPQVIDMQILVYNKKMLTDAGIEPPETMDELIAAAEALTTGDVKGLYLGNDGGAGLMGGPMLWSAGFDYLTDDDEFGFDDPKAAEALGVLRRLWTSDVLLLGQPKDWWAADTMISEQCAMQYTGLWTFPELEAGMGENFGAIPWPAMEGGEKSVTVGAYGSCVSAKASDVQAAKDFASWLWVDQTEDQVDFAGSYGFHIPARTSLIDQVEGLQSGPAADAAAAATEFGKSQNQLLWTPASGAAFNDMMSRIVKDGSDPMEEIRTLKSIVDGELERVLS